MAVFSRSLIVLALPLAVVASVKAARTSEVLQSRQNGGGESHGVDHNDGNGHGHDGGHNGGGDYHPPTPSHRPVTRPSRRRTMESMTGSEIAVEICPSNYYGCPISVAGSLAALPASLSQWLSQGFECVDRSADLRACGGCASLDFKHDCTLIPGANEVACIAGGCVVDSCLGGYTMDSDNQTCIPN